MSSAAALHQGELVPVSAVAARDSGEPGQDKGRQAYPLELVDVGALAALDASLAKLDRILGESLAAERAPQA